MRVQWVARVEADARPARPQPVPRVIDYDPHDWYSHLFDVRGSMVREILGRVLTCVLWSAVVVAAYRFLPWTAIPSTIHSLVGVALGLLLVVRTNASYDRYWEGRKLWGGITNDCRNLARGAVVLLRDDPDLVRRVVEWTAVLPYAIKSVLRKHIDLGPPAARLPRAEVEPVEAAAHPALAVATRITALLDEARARGLIGPNEFVALDACVRRLIDHCGGCERIHGTPLPFPYMVHLRRALILYCFTLPFALVRDFGWGTVLDTLVVAYIFFGIEEIGVEIEDPFGRDDNDLPLPAFCARIAATLDDLLAAASGTPLVAHEDGPPSGG
jgi:putative membrane protein